MLTDALRTIVHNSFKDSFYKKKINVLTIFYKSDVKTFLKWIVNHCSKGTRQYNNFYKI